MANLADRVAFVTGAESGIGAACAQALASEGAAAVLLYFRDAAAARRGQSAIEAAGGRAVCVQADISDEGAVASAFDAAAAAFGAPDILVNSAGLNQSGVQIAEMSAAQWRRLIHTDLTGAFLTCRRFVRDLRAARRAGAIINITSIHADVMRAGAGDYASAKGGLKNLTKTLALECAADRITANAIAPGMILTPMNARAVADASYRDALAASIPLGRAGTAEEVARLSVYLASPSASYITGATITIDGGLSLVLGQGA